MSGGSRVHYPEGVASQSRGLAAQRPTPGQSDHQNEQSNPNGVLSRTSRSDVIEPRWGLTVHLLDQLTGSSGLRLEPPALRFNPLGASTETGAIVISPGDPPVVQRRRHQRPPDAARFQSLQIFRRGHAASGNHFDMWMP